MPTKSTLTLEKNITVLTNLIAKQIKVETEILSVQKEALKLQNEAQKKLDLMLAERKKDADVLLPTPVTN